MLNNQELPMGFTMALAQRSDILRQFALLPDEEQSRLVDGARQVESRDEMRSYVENMLKG